AISGDIFYIVPEKCTECVGFHDHEACAAVCPVDCCVPDPNIPETEAVLLARARTLHPDETFPDDAPSRFRKDGAAAPATAGNGAATAAPSPAAAPAAAAPRPAAAAAPARPALVVSRRVEKPVARPPAARPAPTFRGELPVDYEQLLADLGTPRRRRIGALARTGLMLLAAGQGILGALSDRSKKRIEAAVADRRFFSAPLATAGNVSLNLILYPILVTVLAVAAGRADVFSASVQKWVFLGVVIAVVEAAVRLREGFFRGV